MIEIFKNLLGTNIIENRATVREKVSVLLKVLFSLYVFYMLIVIIMLFTDKFLIEEFGVSIRKNLVTYRQESIEYYGLFGYSISTLLLAPIWEEYQYRGFLVVNRLNVTISAILIFLFSASVVLDIDLVSINGLYLLVGGFGIGWFLFKLMPVAMLVFLQKNSKSLILFSIFTFAFSHVNNYTPIFWKLIWVYPVYVLPQFFLGVGCSYLRIKYQSMLWPILLHFANNLIPILLTVFE
jgi:hypothetical protein